MKISCPACAAKYSIADEKVQDRLAKIRCRKCGATIVIDGKTSPPHVYAAEGSVADHPNFAPASSSEVGREYSVDFGDNDQRTLSLLDVVSAYNAGEINAETFLWAEGMPDWKPLGEIAEIVDALHAAASGPSFAAGAAAPVGAAARAADPWAAPRAQPRAADAAMARTASRKGGRAPSGDLFGSFDAAGGEDDVATSAPQPDIQVATGARNESSVLFSLSALTAAAKPSSPSMGNNAPAGAAASPLDDSGLIDLKALTAAAPRPEGETASIIGSPLGGPPLGAPFGLAAPLGAGVESHIGPLATGRSSKTGLFLGGGIVLAAMVIAVAFILRPEPPPPPAPVAAAPPQIQAPTPAAEPDLAAKPPATGTGEEGAAPDAGDKPAAKSAARSGGGRWRAAPKKAASSDEPSGSPAADKKPAVKRSACGCVSGDLQCAMKCAAKGGG